MQDLRDQSTLKLPQPDESSTPAADPRWLEESGKTFRLPSIPPNISNGPETQIAKRAVGASSVDEAAANRQTLRIVSDSSAGAHGGAIPVAGVGGVGGPGSYRPPPHIGANQIGGVSNARKLANRNIQYFSVAKKKAEPPKPVADEQQGLIERAQRFGLPALPHLQQSLLRPSNKTTASEGTGSVTGISGGGIQSGLGQPGGQKQRQPRDQQSRDDKGDKPKIDLKV